MFEKLRFAIIFLKLSNVGLERPDEILIFGETS